jgi:sigma-E factor negative regulatory protein RseC
MDEIGVVKSIDGLNAKVLISRQGSPCENCTQDTCTIPEKGIETEAINAAGAKVGQKVKVVMKSYTFIKGPIILYIFPLIALIAGAILGKMYLSGYFSETNSDLLAALTGFLALFISILIVKFLTGRMNRKIEYKSVIKSIVEG